MISRLLATKPTLVFLFFLTLSLSSFLSLAFPFSSRAAEPDAMTGDQIREEVEHFAGLGAVGYLVWQYSGEPGVFANDPFAFYRSDGTGPDSACGGLSDSASLMEFVGVNIWSAPSKDASTLTDHFSWLASNCGVSVIRVFGYSGGAAGVQTALDAAAASGVKLIVAIGDYSNGGGGIPKGAKIDWYQSGYRGEYLSLVSSIKSVAAGHPGLYGIELANEPHCGGNAAAASAYNAWAANISSILAGATSNIGIGQMASQALAVCDHPDHNYATSNSPGSITMASGHYYTPEERDQVEKAASVSPKKFYIGEAGFGGGTTEKLTCEIPHSCTCKCKGTAHDPCKFTPENDCSIPDDPKSFTLPLEPLISPITGAQIMDAKTRHALQSQYLEVYLPHTRISFGTQYRMVGDLDIGDCFLGEGAEWDIFSQYCRHGFNNQAFITGIADSIRLNSFEDAGDDVDQNKLQYLSHGEVANAPTTERTGENLKLLPLGQYWNRMADIQKLKSFCHKNSDFDGDIAPPPDHNTNGLWIDYIPNPRFSSAANDLTSVVNRWGRVRCMNYQILDCPDCNNPPYDTELNLFGNETRVGPLSPCLNGYSLACQAAYSNLPETVRQAVKAQLPTFPKQRTLWIVASDQLPPESETHTNILDLVDLITSKIKSSLDLGGKLVRYQTQDHELDLRSYYASFGAVTGLDTQKNAEITRNSFFPLSQNSRPDTKRDYTSVWLTSDENDPFYFNHIPSKLAQYADPTVPTGLSNDLRYNIIQYFLRRDAKLCTNNSFQKIDLSNNFSQHQLTPSKALYVSPNTDPGPDGLGGDADLIALHDAGFTDNFDINRYLLCILGPNNFDFVDQLNHDLNRALIPLSQQQTALKWHGSNIGVPIVLPQLQVDRDPVTTKGACFLYGPLKCEPTGEDANGDGVIDLACEVPCEISYNEPELAHSVRKTTTVPDPIGALNPQEVNQLFSGIKNFFQKKKYKFEYLRPLSYKKTRCDKDQDTWWECLNQFGSTSGTSPSQEPGVCTYRDQTTTIPSPDELKSWVCNASTQHNVPGFLLRSIFSIEGGEAIRLFNEDQFGATVPCQVSNSGDVGPMQINVAACRQPPEAGTVSGHDLCDFETAIGLAGSVLKSRAKAAGISKPPSAWTYQDIYKAAGYYNGAPEGSCGITPGAGTDLSGGDGLTYCGYAAEAFLDDTFWHCPTDPDVSNPGGPYTR